MTGRGRIDQGFGTLKMEDVAAAEGDERRSAIAQR